MSAVSVLGASRAGESQVDVELLESSRGGGYRGLERVQGPRRLVLTSCCRYRRHREASVETWSHDLLALFLGEVNSHHGVFDCLHYSVYKSIPCVGMGEVSSLDVSFPES